MISGNFTALTFTIKIKRNPMFYDFMIVKPAVMLSMMTFFIFLMPPSATDRYTYGKDRSFLNLTLLLSQTHYYPANIMTDFTQNCPKPCRQWLYSLVN